MEIEEMKICPLKRFSESCATEQAFASLLVDEDSIREAYMCDGGRCAWFDAERGCCGVIAVK